MRRWWVLLALIVVAGTPDARDRLAAESSPSAEEIERRTDEVKKRFVDLAGA